MEEKRRWKVFLVDEIHPEALQYLAGRCEIISDWDRLGEADAAVVRRIMHLEAPQLAEAVNLKVIGFHGVGIHNVDMDLIRQRGIDFFTTPGANAVSVAELNVALALDAAHLISRSVHEIKSGRSMQDALSRFRGHEISGKTACFIGMGNIGRRTAAMLMSAFGMKVCAYSLDFTREQAADLGVTYIGALDDIFPLADFLFLSIPFTKETEHIICARRLRMMKPTAVLINTARGGLVDEAALHTALTGGWIAAAACDVVEKEPVGPANPLTALDNFILTPHIGGNSDEALYRVGMAVAEGICGRLEKL